MNRRTIALLVAVGACLIAQTTRADEVVLVNGDRFTGRVVRKIGDVLMLDTPYAGAINLRWSDVATITTDNPVDVVLLGNPLPVSAVLSSAYDGSIDLIGVETDVPLINVVYINPPPEEVGGAILHSGHAKVALTRVRGNTTSDQVYADADFVGRSKRFRYNLLGKTNQNWEGDRKVAANWLGTANYDYFLRPTLFLYLRGSVESDRFKDIDRRSTLGTGYGVQVIETPRGNISLRGGIDYVTINRFNAEDEHYPAIGWGLRVAQKIGTGGVEAFHDHDGFSNLRSSSEVTIRSRTGMRIPVFERLNLSIQYNADWEKKPAAGRKSTDSNLLVGMGYTW